VSTLAEVPYHRIDDPEKLRRLMAAVLMVSADIELPELLRHFISETCALVEARYGALGVLNPARTALDQFLTVGLSDEEEQQIGPRPTGRGVLGLLITDPEALRLTDLHSHPDSYGFPPHHPPMNSFLGVRLRVRGEVYGNLYLTDKLNGEAFSEEDEAMAEALAQAAGIAIQNTRLNDTVRLVGLLDDRPCQGSHGYIYRGTASDTRGRPGDSALVQGWLNAQGDFCHKGRQFAARPSRNAWKDSASSPVAVHMT
jgi:transcriptional regulator with GAF, ATPase, and Fis domain